MWAHPGKKLLFMGGEFGQYQEWNHDTSLDWHLLAEQKHRGVQSLVRELNRVYRDYPALYQLDCKPEGFQWLQLDNHQHSIFAWSRFGNGGAPPVVVLVNMTPQTHQQYRLGVPRAGRYQEIINTDARVYGGSGQGNPGRCATEPVAWDNQSQSLVITVPPLATVYFLLVGEEQL
jgi:1,4-alpha-glucan branching enzyme